MTPLSPSLTAPQSPQLLSFLLPRAFSLCRMFPLVFSKTLPLRTSLPPLSTVRFPRGVLHHCPRFKGSPFLRRKLREARPWSPLEPRCLAHCLRPGGTQQGLTKQRRDGAGKTEGGRRCARKKEEFPSKLRCSIRLKGNSRPRGKEGPLKMGGLVLVWNAGISQSRAVWMRGQWMVGWPPERLLQRLWSRSTYGLALCDWLLSLDIAGENGCGHKVGTGVLGLSSGFSFAWQHRAVSTGNLWRLNRHRRNSLAAQWLALSTVIARAWFNPWSGN